MPCVVQENSLVVGAIAFECVGGCLWVWSATYDINVGVRAKLEL